jgi:hypothetical protein
MDGNRILALLAFIRVRVADWHRLGRDHWEWDLSEPESYHDRVTYWFEKLAYENYQIWHCRDDPRRFGDEIARHNRARNHAIEAMDALFLEVRGEPRAGDGCNPETPGSIIDRANTTIIKLCKILDINDSTAVRLKNIQNILDNYTYFCVLAARLTEWIVAGTRPIQIAKTTVHGPEHHHPWPQEAHD